MKEPILQLETDDIMSMSSKTTLTIERSLGRVELKHESQNGLVDIIQLFPNQLEPLSRFLLESKKWIESGYKDELKPKSFKE